MLQSPSPSPTSPRPILESLEPGDTFLYAQWKNNPYMGIYNAYLLVVNTSDFHDIRYIYLTEEEALDEAMKIEDLKNGTEYVVQYTQTQNAPDGVQGNSNTLSETPLDTPNPPEILFDDEYSVIVGKNSVNNVYTIKLWVDYGVGTYNPPLEKTTFKIISRTKSEMQIVSQEFDVLSQYVLSNDNGRYKQFELTNITKDLYAISCFNINNNGVGPLSNVIEVDVGDLPFFTDVTEVISGLDSQLDIHVSTKQNNVYGFNIIQFNIFYSIATQHGDHDWKDGGHLTNITVDQGNVTAEGFITDLTNGEKYVIKAVAVNVNGPGPSRNEGTGVPAKQSSVTNVAITNANANGGIVNASWDKIDGTFEHPSYMYKLVDGDHNTTIKEDTVSTNSISLTDLNIIAGENLKLSVTPLDTVPQELLSYWINPLLLDSVTNNWVGQTVTSDSYTINNKPLPLTSIVCSSVGDGTLTYTFVKPLSSSSYNAPTKYTIELSTSIGFVNIIKSVDITEDLSSVSSNQFTGLTNNTSYYARIFASNEYGTSGNVSTGPNQPLEPIKGVTGLIKPSQLSTPLSSYPDLYTFQTDWKNWKLSSHVGYTLVDYTVNVYEYIGKDGPYNLVSSENTTTSSYVYNGTLGNTYYFGVIVNATINQSINGVLNTPISSAETKSEEILISGLPYIYPDSVKFGTQIENGLGKIEFAVDGRYSSLLGLFTLILPDDQKDPSLGNKTDVFQTQPYYYPLFDEDDQPLKDSAYKKTYTANLRYKIPSDERKKGYIIYAVNSIGSSYITAGLTTNTNTNNNVQLGGSGGIPNI
jgi:hypothetical protein